MLVSNYFSASSLLSCLCLATWARRYCATVGVNALPVGKHPRADATLLDIDLIGLLRTWQHVF
jgi:hypothetical protein